MGLASMVRNRGGMRGMRASSPFLEKVLYWYAFTESYGSMHDQADSA
jgi:hypothetical protein